MHIVIGLITALGGLFWALNSLERSGFRLSSLNPFHWFRRNQWKKQYNESPLYLLENPMDAAAAVLLGVAKLEGEISREHKEEILKIFANEFNLDLSKAQELFSASSYLLQAENNFIRNVGKVLTPSKDKFSPEQADSLIRLLRKIAEVESEISADQNELIDAVEKALRPTGNRVSKW